MGDEGYAYPEWTEYRKKNGLDPLGMQTGSIHIYQRLLPGISNVTLRIRYYGLYAWLARSYAKDIGDTDPKKWQRYVRRAEALYALVAQHKGGENGVAGVEWATKVLPNGGTSEIDFSAAAEPGSPNYYLKQPWGAYGAAYASQLFDIGIFAQTTGHDIPVPSKGLGDRLADTFDADLPSSKSFLAAVGEGKVSLSQLEQFADITPSSIASNGEERTCYEDILFANAGLTRQEDVDRKHSLLLLLNLTSHLGSVPGVFDVRWLLYGGLDSQSKQLVFPSDDLQAHRWVYHANDLLHICYEALLKFCLDVLEDYPSGIALSGLVGEVSSRLLTARDDTATDWQAFIAVNPAPANCLRPGELSGEFELQRKLLRKTRLDGICSPSDAWLAIKLLAVLQNRVHASGKDPADELRHLDRNLVRSLVTELYFFDAHSSEPLPTFIARLVEERVIRRHLWVGLRKFRYQGDYTFLIETDNGRVRKRAADGPVFTNPRLAPALTFLRDIHLVDDKGLTARGRELAGAA
jgi:hypothetical protein